MIRLAPKVQGFTTNPTLMRKVGVVDYKAFAKIVLDKFPDKPVSLEVIADDFKEMERQARLIASWGPNAYVKIPITNTKGESSIPMIKDLADLNLNITAVMDVDQIRGLLPTLGLNHIISYFCGRIMDTQRLAPRFIGEGDYQLLWASAREIYNVTQAEEMGYDIITLSPELFAKLDLKGKDLNQYSLETVQQFFNDAQKAGYVL